MTTEMPPTGPVPADQPAETPTPAAPVPAPAAPAPAAPTPAAPVPAAPVEAPAATTAAQAVAVASPVDAPQLPASAPPAAPPVPTRRRRDRILGTTGQIVGIVGIVVCLLLVVGVVFGRGWAVSTVDDLTATVDAKITELSPILTQAHTTVGEVSGKVSTVADIAAGIAADPTPGGELAQTLRDAIAGVNDRYQSLRAGYAGIRETALSIIDKLQTLDSLIPGLTIPQGPIDALNTFDARLQEFDAKVNDLLTIDPGTGPVNQAAGKISAAASGIDSKLKDVQDGITQVDDRVTQLRTDIANVANTVNLVITLVTVFIVVLLLYLALLHWVLFRHSGEIRRKTTTG